MSFKVNYGLMAVALSEDKKDAGIIHFCAYENPPDEQTFKALEEELKTDPEFGLTDRDDWQLVEASPEIVEIFREEIGATGQQHFAVEKQGGCCCEEDYDCECE